MGTTIRMLPKNGVTVTGWAGPPEQSAAGSRRYYTAAAGSYADVTALDANVLGSQGFLQVGNGSGPTSLRPNLIGDPQAPGFQYLDTTLGLIVVWNGAGWVNPVTGATA